MSSCDCLIGYNSWIVCHAGIILGTVDNEIMSVAEETHRVEEGEGGDQSVKSCMIEYM